MNFAVLIATSDQPPLLDFEDDSAITVLLIVMNSSKESRGG
jgi:hypothetical protein